MRRTQEILVIFLILKLTEADYYCTSQSGICSVEGQSVSATDPFVITRNNTAPITLLIIDNGFMPQAPQTIFSNHPRITFLSISNVSLQEISPNVFINASKLTSLIIMDGYLTTLNNGTFSSCGKLQSLQVVNQELSFIDVMAFHGLKNLQNLFLSNNQLTSLHPLLLSVLPKLMNFNAENNLLTAIDSQQFINNPTLYGVTLTANQIKSLPNDLFQTQIYIASILADQNQLVTAQSYGANYVDVSFNRIRNFTISSGEQTIHIENNIIRKIICTNSNLTVQRFYADNNLLTSFLCIRDMVNLTDLSVINNKMPKPTKKAFLKLVNLQIFYMYNMTRFNTVPAKIFAPLVSLFNLKVDHLEAYKNLNVTMPSLSLLALTTNTWNCTHLSTVKNILSSQDILLLFNVESDRERCNL